MLREQLLQALKELKLHGMRSVLDEVLVTGTRQKSIPEKILLELLNAEQAERQMRSTRYRMGQAKFPMPKDLDQFDFSVSPVNETQVRTLYEGQFLRHKATSSWSAAPEPAKPIWRLLSPGRSSAAVNAAATSTWLTWSINWNRKN